MACSFLGTRGRTTRSYSSHYGPARTSRTLRTSTFLTSGTRWTSNSNCYEREGRAMAGVLDGLRVLDLTWGVAGPIAAMLLADHGAAVTRVEHPDGDPFAGFSGYRVWHRGKRSAVLDLREPADREVFLALVARADVLGESFSPGAAERLRLSGLTERNPRLVHCSITGYGDGAEDADRPAYDALVAARTGQ